MERKDIGKVVCVEDHNKKKVRDNWLPCLVVAPTLQSSVRANVVEDYLVRSFKDGKYYAVPKKDITEFTKEIGARVENPTLKTAVEKALLFLDKDELPPHWDRNLLFGVGEICIPTDNKAVDNDNSDKESIEDKDHFIAQLFKFMDDRGTPLNQAPVINDKDVDLYKLFKVVNSYGGCNKVNTGKLWQLVANKAGYEPQSYLSIQHCYTQYLHSFEDFYRKLGSTMWSHPRVVRSSRKFSRSIIRDVDKAFPSTSSATDKNKTINNELRDKKNKNSAVTKKKAKSLKTEEKLLKNNEEISKKDDKKKEDSANSMLLSKQLMKWDPKITDLKDPVRNSKTKKEMKIILKKELDSDAIDDDQIIGDEKVENKMYKRNVRGKSELKTNMKKRRLIKEQVKTYFEDMSFKKLNRGISYTHASNKEKLDEEVPKLTRSKTALNLRSRSRRASILSDLADGASVVQLTQPRFLDNLVKIKKEDVTEKKRKKKDDKEGKVSSNVTIPTPNSIENAPFDKDSPLVIGDNLVVYYGGTTYDAKVINVCDIEGVMKYYVHYKGWNSRYDEWIDGMRIAYKKKEQEPEEDNDADCSKSSIPKQKNVVSKKVPTISNKIRRSVNPLASDSNIKKSRFSNTRPTRTCTLTGSLFNIDNSDSDEEYTLIVGSPKQYSKKKVIKSEPNIIITTDPLDTNNRKKTLNPKTYPSKKVLMEQSVPRKPKSCVLNVYSNKSQRNDLKHISESNITGTDFDDIIENTESFMLDQQIKIDASKTIEPVIDYAYKFKEYESGNFYLIPSVIEDTPIRHDSPKLFNLEKPDELTRVIDSPSQEQVVEQNGLMVSFVPNSTSIYLYDNNVEIKVNENLNITNKVKNPIMRNESDNESNESQNLMISNVTVDMQNVIEIEPHFQDEVNVSDLKYEVLDLCMNPPKSPLTNVFSISEARAQ